MAAIHNDEFKRDAVRVADVLKTNRFDSALDLEQTLTQYVVLYNTQLRSQPLGAERRCRP